MHPICQFQDAKSWMKEEWLTNVDEDDMKRYQQILDELDVITRKYTEI